MQFLTGGAKAYWGPIGAPKWLSGAPDEGAYNKHNLAYLHRAPFSGAMSLKDSKFISIEAIRALLKGPLFVVCCFLELFAKLTKLLLQVEKGPFSKRQGPPVSV